MWSTSTRPHLQHPTRTAFAKLVYVIYIITEGTMLPNKNIKELNQPLGSINLIFFFRGLVILWANCMDAVNCLSFVDIRAVSVVTKLFNEGIILLSPSAYVGDNLLGRQGILYLFYLPSTKLQNLRLLTKNCKKNTDAVGRLLIWKL